MAGSRGTSRLVEFSCVSQVPCDKNVILLLLFFCSSPLLNFTSSLSSLFVLLSSPFSRLSVVIFHSGGRTHSLSFLTTHSPSSHSRAVQIKDQTGLISSSSRGSSFFSSNGLCSLTGDSLVLDYFTRSLSLSQKHLSSQVRSLPHGLPSSQSLPKMFAKALASAALLASYAVTAVNAVDTISAVGSKFFYKNGTQYYMKGTPALSLHDED